MKVPFLPLLAISSIVAGVGFVVLHRQSVKRQTKLRDQEAKARDMEEFASRVAHDIRGPLWAAALATEMLDERSKSDEEKALIGRLQRSLTRAASIIDGLLAFARAGAHPEPGARANVHEVAHDIADGMELELQRANVALEVETIPAVSVRCSNGVLVSLIGNLVRNAVKYMGASEARRITIRAHDSGSAVRIEVSDTGPGIAPDVLPRLFEPYFRVTSNTQPGLGLGLPTVRKLAEGHGGRVGVSSTVGQGSMFWFELPV